MNLQSLFTKAKAAKAAPDEVAQIEAIIHQANQPAIEAHKELADIAKRRSDLLASDDDEALDRDDRRAEVLNRVIEKRDLAISELNKQLRQARDARLKASIDRHHDFLRIRQQELKASLRATFEANEAALAAFEAATVELGVVAADKIGRVHFQGALHREHFDAWSLAMDQQLGVGSKPAPAAVQRPVASVTKPATNIVAKIAPSPERPKRQKLAETPPPGMRRVMILSHGYECPEGVKRAVGEHVDLPEDVAEAELRNGAVDLLGN